LLQSDDEGDETRLLSRSDEVIGEFSRGDRAFWITAFPLSLGSIVGPVDRATMREK
jgi:hypothetical protein